MVITKLKEWKKQRERNRVKLRKDNDKWVNCIGLISQYDIYSLYNPYIQSRVCLTHVSVGKRSFEHIWVSSEQIYQNFLKHDIIQFKAKIKPYRRKDGSMAFGLHEINNIKLLKGVGSQ